MKRNILISLLLVMFINSCVTYYYYVDTDVLGDMSVDRKVYASSLNDHGPDMTFVKSGEWKDIKVAKPFNVDFYDKIVEMTEGAAAHVDELLHAIVFRIALFELGRELLGRSRIDPV